MQGIPLERARSRHVIGAHLGDRLKSQARALHVTPREPVDLGHLAERGKSLGVARRLSCSVHGGIGQTGVLARLQLRVLSASSNHGTVRRDRERLAERFGCAGWRLGESIRGGGAQKVLGGLGRTTDKQQQIPGGLGAVPRLFDQVLDEQAVGRIAF